ncbi:hypothetical protein HY632_01145 [Candidatus Uhrbacteria bacterium]|nr:hypothetical protein [Candidatus Uhrbacteria bacterium]
MTTSPTPNIRDAAKRLREELRGRPDVETVETGPVFGVTMIRVIFNTYDISAARTSIPDSFEGHPVSVFTPKRPEPK